MVKSIVKLKRTRLSNFSTSPGGHVLDRISNQKGVSHLLPSTSCRQFSHKFTSPIGWGTRTYKYFTRLTNQKINIRYKSTLPGGQVLDRISNRNNHALDRILNQKGVSYLLPSTSCRQVSRKFTSPIGWGNRTYKYFTRLTIQKQNIRYKSTLPGEQVLERI
jgi:hypothetical protein